MRKTYATPALLTSGNVVRETLQSTNSSRPETVNPMVYKPAMAGSVGFGF